MAGIGNHPAVIRMLAKAGAALRKAGCPMNYSAEIAELKGMIEGLMDAVEPLVRERKERIEAEQRLAEATKDERLTEGEAQCGIFIDACGIKA